MNQPAFDKNHNLKDQPKAILLVLQSNPFALDETIARDSGVNLDVSTVRGWLQALRNEKLLTDQVRLVDPVGAGVMLRYRVDVTIDSPRLNTSCETGTLKQLHADDPNKQRRLAYYIRDHVAPSCKDVFVEEVAILLGDPADLTVTVLVPRHEVIFSFVTEHLRCLDEVKSTSTSHVSWRTDQMFKVSRQKRLDRRTTGRRHTSSTGEGSTKKPIP